MDPFLITKSTKGKLPMPVCQKKKILQDEFLIMSIIININISLYHIEKSSRGLDSHWPTGCATRREGEGLRIGR